jgi:peptidoglycan/LPS O-acetylase OafA/YrhL
MRLQSCEGRGSLIQKVAVRRGSLTWPGAEIPSLDGLRGIAAMAVVPGHLGVTASNAICAVICFFVLQGFLITHSAVARLQR